MMAETRGITNAPGAAQMFGNAGREYKEKYVHPYILTTLLLSSEEDQFSPLLC